MESKKDAEKHYEEGCKYIELKLKNIESSFNARDFFLNCTVNWNAKLLEYLKQYLNTHDITIQTKKDIVIYMNKCREGIAAKTTNTLPKIKRRRNRREPLFARLITTPMRD